MQAFKTGAYENHKNFNKDRVAGTCRWVLDHPYYKKWSHSSRNDLLWISADPGCGKSVLSKFLVDHELAATKDTTICYYFFKDNEQQDRLAPALCATLHQLFSKQPHLIRHAIPLWEENGAGIQEEIGIMWQILLDATSDETASAVVCVFDALDECRNEDQQELVTRLCRFRERPLKITSRTSLKFLVTSRPYDSVQRWFDETTSRLPHIRLRGEDENDRIHKEINLVVDQRLKSLAIEFRLSKRHLDKLRQRLQNMEHRTYLWLYLAMEEIRTQYRDGPDPEEESIANVPTSVEKAYEQILQRITDQQRPHARRILLIIVGARRSLTIGEASLAFNAATAYENDHPVVKEPNVAHFEKRVREWCGLFVFINHSKLFLLHQTAKEFLLTNVTTCDVGARLWRSSLSVTQVEFEMATICIAYLCLAVVGQDSLHQTLDDDTESDFLQYCAMHWASHLCEHKIRDDKKLLEMVLVLYDTVGKPFDTWFRIWFRIKWVASHPLDKRPHVQDQHAIAIIGHAVVLEERYKRQAFEVDFRDSTDRTALMWAAEVGSTEAVRVLLGRGANVNAQGGKYGNPLHAALCNDHDAIARILLHNRADVNAIGKYWNESDTESLEGSALQAASYVGREEAVQMLFDEGADVNAEGGEYGNALQAASYRGCERVVQMLLDKGAKVNVQGGKYGNALQAASWGGWAGVVKMLLGNEADVNAQGGEFGNALQAALARGNEKVVQMLLHKGAEVHVQGGRYGNILQAAAALGHEKIVQTLLNEDADVNAQIGEYGNALQAASHGGREGVVQMLLGKGAKVNAQGGKYGNALQAASARGHEKVIRILLENGADISAQGGEHGNALQAAAINKHIHVLKILIERTIEVDAGLKHALDTVVHIADMKLLAELLGKLGIGWDELERIEGLHGLERVTNNFARFYDDNLRWKYLWRKDFLEDKNHKSHTGRFSTGPVHEEASRESQNAG